MLLTEAIPEQRISEDRRAFSWRTVVFGFARSRRCDLRRDDEGEVLFLDSHHPWLSFLAVGIMLLSCADALMTLQLLQLGMVEVNPVMAAVIEHGTGAFASMKMAMTGIGILTLVFLAKARFMDRVRTGLFLTMFFSAYSCLICYEFVYLLKCL
jgi:hypothetical protein